MARYDYQCLECNIVFEVKMSIKEKDLVKEITCIKCKGSNTIQMFNSITVLGGKSTTSATGCSSCSKSQASCSSCG